MRYPPSRSGLAYHEAEGGEVISHRTAQRTSMAVVEIGVLSFER